MTTSANNVTTNTNNPNGIIIDSVELTKTAVVVKARNEKLGWTSTYPLSRVGKLARKDIGQFILMSDSNNFYRREVGLKALLLDAGAIESAYSNEQLAKQKQDKKRMDAFERLKALCN